METFPSMGFCRCRSMEVETVFLCKEMENSVASFDLDEDQP